VNVAFVIPAEAGIQGSEASEVTLAPACAAVTDKARALNISDALSAVTSIGFHGVALAMVLYLVSVGLSVTMGLMGFVNLAHGVFAMLGGYVVTSLMTRHSVPFSPALLCAALVIALGSVVVERLLYRRLYGGDELGFRSFPAFRSFLILCGAALVTLLWLGLERTRFGARVRASVDNLRMAQSVGINTSRLFMLTFALGSGLAGLGGGLGADLLSINPSYALDNLVYFLIVVAVGGLGSIRGPFVAALLIGVADTGFKYLLPELGAFFIYVLTMAILLWRPRGLFGRA